MTQPPGYPLNSPAQLRDLLIGFRKEQKLTQAALAEKLGITQQSYAQIEANPAAASFERLYRILRLLDVRIELSRASAMPYPGQPPARAVAQAVQPDAPARQDAPDQDDW